MDCYLSGDEFWVLCARLKREGLQDGRLLSIPSAVMLYRGKIRQDLDFETIGMHKLFYRLP